MRVFVSCQAVDGDSCSRLIRALRSAGVDVDHSPKNPADGHDPRWTGWYAQGLAAAIAGRDVSVIVLDVGWDSSTWMMIEAEALFGAASASPERRVFFWNPDGIIIRAGLRYLKDELPQDVDDAMRAIVGTG